MGGAARAEAGGKDQAGARKRRHRRSASCSTPRPKRRASTRSATIPGKHRQAWWLRALREKDGGVPREWQDPPRAER
jgi:hypothetical protein